jgi:hypothetical protein
MQKEDLLTETTFVPIFFAEEKKASWDTFNKYRISILQTSGIIIECEFRRAIIPTDHSFLVASVQLIKKFNMLCVVSF